MRSNNSGAIAINQFTLDVTDPKFIIFADPVVTIRVLPIGGSDTLYTTYFAFQDYYNSRNSILAMRMHPENAIALAHAILKECQPNDSKASSSQSNDSIESPDRDSSPHNR